MKKVLSYVLIICMMIGMVPFVFDGGYVHADQYNMIAILSYAGNQPSSVAMLNDDVYYINDDAGAFTMVGADADNYNSYFDGTENRLVLKDAVITAGALAVVANRDTIIELYGDNYIESYVFGIDDENNNDTSLIITGSGVLEVHALKHPTGMVNNTGGVAVRRNLIIGGNATLKAYGAEDESATSGEGTKSFGIYLMGGSLTVRDNAVVEAYGQDANSTDSDAESYGICAARDVTVTDSAMLRAYSGDAVTSDDKHAYSMAVYSGSGNVSVGADARLIAASGNVQLGATGSNPSNHPVSCGVNAGIDLSQSNHINNHRNISIYGNGRITASAGQATYTGSGAGVEPESYGLYADNIMLAGGRASAESDITDGGSLELSYGIRTLAGFTAANAVIQAEDILADSDFTMTGANASVLNLKADNVTVSDASTFSGCINAAGTALFNESSYSRALSGTNSDATAISASAVTVTDSSFDITLDNQFRNITLIDTGNLSFNNTSFNADLSAAEATGSVKVLRCSNFNCEGGSIDIALCNASAGSIGIDCASFTLTDAESAVISGSTTHEDTYAIKATGAVNISSGAVLNAAHIAGLGAGGSFTLAEGLHWATAAGVATTNGAYTWSADDSLLTITTSAIVPYSGGSSHHSGGGGGSSASGAGTTETVAPDGNKTTVTVSADGSKTTVKTDANGNLVSVEAAISEKAVAGAVAKGEAVKLGVSVKAATSAEEAVPVKVVLPASVTPKNPATVEIPVENMTAGTVAVVVYGDGTEEIVKTSVAGEDGIVMLLEGSETIKIIDNTKSFSDVTGSEWFAGNVAWAASREIMNGIGGGIFDAGSLTNRGMISQILFNLEGARATAAQMAKVAELFSDVSTGNWFAGSVGWMVANDIAQGQGDDFGAADPVTREQLAVLYFNYAKYKGYDTGMRGSVEGFADSGRVSPWAQEALAWAVGKGIINGTALADGSIALDPQGSSTRAMVAAITQRFCEKLL